MTYILSYDISTYGDEPAMRQDKIRRLCRKYGNSVQKSVFQVENISKALLRVFCEKLEQLVDVRFDRVVLYKLAGKKDRIVIGKPFGKDDPDESII